MKRGDYPDFVKVKFVKMNLKNEVNFEGISPKLNLVPKELPTWT